jgi:hypothetical protein
MKLINSEMPIFMNISINPVFQIVGDNRKHLDCTSLYTSALPPLNKRHHLHTFPSFVTPFPYILTSWQWILAGQMFSAFKNRITERTSQSTGLVIDMVLYKAL